MSYQYKASNLDEAGTQDPDIHSQSTQRSQYSSLAGALELHSPSSYIHNDELTRKSGWPHASHSAVPGARLMWPTNHILVPQILFSEELATPKSYPDTKYPPIVFQLVDFPEVGVRISRVVGKDTPRIAGAQDKVLDIGDREIKIWLLWPGYDEPLQKRLKTQSGTITRDTLLLIIANVILNFMEKMKNSRVKSGHEAWAIGTHPNGRPGIAGPALFITRLIHRGGSNWQPELWAPRFT
ncbi:hypothetical protein AX17_007321 [Amanita inopinata Kibby_2008]|nr:hypothetical protein AX17_007321 [Amanita inopinata Kibby_2008]